uniref:Uncharacterized protein n=1 Tax=Cyanoderma ruficeps TaxID=181631 RepID=A0A8C3QX22_9PASS
MCNMSHPGRSPKLSFLCSPAPAAASASDAPSDYYEVCQSRYPPLMQESSWTLAAPFKEQHLHRNLSDSIANNYTLTARDLKLKNMKKFKSFSMIEISHISLGLYSPCHLSLNITASLFTKLVFFFSKSALLKCLNRISLSVPAHTPELHVINYTDNQPLTPEEQFALMDLHEKEISKQEKQPSSDDLERYCHYIHNGVREDMLAPQDKEVVNKILKHIPTHIPPSPELERFLARLKEEIKTDYCTGLMKAIVDYVLLDPAERKRLSIQSTPRPFPRRIICAPVPWHSSYKETKSWNESNLFIVNSLMPTLQELWLSQYSHLRFVRTAEVLCADLPLLPAEFQDIIQRHCGEARDILQNKWIPTCASIFIARRNMWLHFAPQRDSDSPEKVESYFSSVAALMSLQLREMVINSLEDLLAFFMIHKDGNDFKEPYQGMQFFLSQILTVKLCVKEPDIVFEPSLGACWDLISHCFQKILQSAEELPKVLDKQFEYICFFLQRNFASETYVCFCGLLCLRYLNVYRKYSNLLNNKSRQDVTKFLEKSPSLEALTEKINSFTELKREIASMDVTVPLAMFCLDALQLNEELCNRTQNLKDTLIEFAVVENRQLNQRYLLFAWMVLAVCLDRCYISVDERLLFFCWVF